MVTMPVDLRTPASSESGLADARGWRLEDGRARRDFCNVRNGEDFAEAEANEAFAEARFGVEVRRTRGALAGSGQARGKFVKAVDAGDFFDEIDLALDFGAPEGCVHSQAASRSLPRRDFDRCARERNRAR